MSRTKACEVPMSLALIHFEKGFDSIYMVAKARIKMFDDNLEFPTIKGVRQVNPLRFSQKHWKIYYVNYTGTTKVYLSIGIT